MGKTEVRRTFWKERSIVSQGSEQPATKIQSMVVVTPHGSQQVEIDFNGNSFKANRALDSIKDFRTKAYCLRKIVNDYQEGGELVCGKEAIRIVKNQLKKLKICWINCVIYKKRRTSRGT